MESHKPSLKLILLTRKGMCQIELLPYFDLKEVVHFSTINKAARHICEDHFHFNEWRTRATLIADYWNMEHFEDDYKNYEEYRNSKVLKKVKDTEFTYRRHNPELQLIETLAYAGGMWSWKDTPQYYEMRTLETNNFGLKVNYLKTVCWFNPFVVAENVHSGAYKVYILHGRDEHSGMIDKAKFWLRFCEQGQEEQQELYRDEHFISQNNYKEMPLNVITKDFITIIKLPPTTQNKTYKLVLQFEHKDMNWKSGWYFEGICLEPIKEEKIGHQSNLKKKMKSIISQLL